MLGQRRRRWPTIDSIPGRASFWLGAGDYNAPCRPIHDTPTQCWLNVGPPSVTPVQPRPSIVSQRMSTRRKIMRIKVAVSSAAQKHGAFNTKVGLMLGKCNRQTDRYFIDRNCCKQWPNIKLALCQSVG